MGDALPLALGPPALRPVLHHDWVRRVFAHLPERPDWAEHLNAAYVYPGTSLDFVARSREGLGGAVLAARQPDPRAGRRRRLLWHGSHTLLEEAFFGWFGPRVQPVRGESFRILLDRVPHFLIADAATRPTFVLPLGDFVSLGVSHGVLEAVLDAPVVVAAQGLYARAAFVPSLRVFAAYDGRRYAESTRKLFYNAQGDPVSVEAVAREALARLAYDVVHPAVFRRLFAALVGRPATHFEPAVWPRAFLAGRLSPLEWAQRALDRLAEARRDGVRPRLDAALAEAARRPWTGGAPPAPHGLPLVGRYLSRDRYEPFLEAAGDRRLLAVLEGYVLGYEAANADWFAWQPGGRSFLCEVKSTGDTLRPTQKASILWCQRGGLLEYRLLEVVHRHARDPAGTVLNAA